MEITLKRQNLLKVIFATVLLWVSAGVAKAEPLVSADWLASNLNNDKLVIIDLRNKLDKGGYKTFLDGHIPGSGC